MTGDDLKRLQDHFLEGAKKILLEHGKLRPVGFVVTLHKHVDKLFENGYGIEFLDPKECVRAAPDDSVATLIIDLSMNWKRLYHAVLSLSPQARDVLPAMVEMGKSIDIDDPYMRVMRAFMKATQLEEKDIVAATMRQICDKVEAFASIFQSEAWQRIVAESSETVDQIYENAPEGLGQDPKSTEIVVSSMETYEFARMIALPIQREPSKTADREEGKILGFGTQAVHETVVGDKNVLDGRMVRFLKPLKDAS